MFIITPEPNREMQVLLRGIKSKLGHVPPHWELFASINPTRFKMFLDEINYLTAHPHIHRDFFAFLRYAVATDNGFGYCTRFNRQFLLSHGYTLNDLHSVEGTEKTVPLDEKHQALFTAALTAVYDSDNFTAETIASLHRIGWSNADIFDAVDHAAFLFKFARILKTYIDKAKC
ncbi:hypothetical protein MNB_SV-10-1588 [hydrothermal vent metagenome]|uniref:Uncharacterized protein n=1 Tax=hydrothermal vent metagenome TaxID=652676 RepID=A0A1W1CQX6_9ZZZZ